MTERRWCDKCGKKAAIRILYGSLRLEGLRRGARHQAVIGGRCATKTSPRWRRAFCSADLWPYQVERAEDRERRRERRLTRPDWQDEVLRAARANYGRERVK